MPTKATITRATKALHGRLYLEEVPADEPEASTGTQQAAPANLAGELSEFLRSSHGTNRPETDTFTKEFNLHVSGGERTIQQTYEALLVVPPTSVEAERVFFRFRTVPYEDTMPNERLHTRHVDVFKVLF